MKKFLTVVAVLVVVLSAILAVLDRVGVYQAEQQIADRLVSYLEQEGMTSSARPEVTVTGIPFLTQAIAGEYDEIKVSLKDLDGGPLPMPLISVRVNAFDVQAPLSGIMDGDPQVVIGRVEGEGSVTYEQLVKSAGLTGMTLSGTGGSTLNVTGKLAIIGTVTGTAEVSTSEDRIRIRITDLKSDNSALTAIARRLIDQYSNRAFIVEVPGLPFNARLTGAETDPAGLKLRFAANDVRLA